MKFGKYLEDQGAEHPEWKGKLIDYNGLKDILKALHDVAKPPDGVICGIMHVFDI